MCHMTDNCGPWMVSESRITKYPRVGNYGILYAIYVVIAE